MAMFGISSPENIKRLNSQNPPDPEIAGDRRNDHDHPQGNREIAVGNHGRITRESPFCEPDQKRTQPDSQTITSKSRKGSLEQDHAYQFTALCADSLQRAKSFQVFENEGVERLAGERQSDDETDQGHDQHVRSSACLVDEEVLGPLHEFFFGPRAIAEGLHLLLDLWYVARALRLNKHVGGRVPRIGDVLDSSLEGGIQCRDAI